jgi:hypothetical protein
MGATGGGEGLGDGSEAIQLHHGMGLPLGWHRLEYHHFRPTWRTRVFSVELHHLRAHIHTHTHVNRACGKCNDEFQF